MAFSLSLDSFISHFTSMSQASDFQVKQCSNCKEYKPLSEFSKEKRAKSGLRSWCKVCDHAQQNVWRKTHPEARREYDRIYKDKHRARRRELGREYSKKHGAEKRLRRRQRIKDNGGRFTDDEWFYLRVKFGNRCLACGQVGGVLPDHVIPLSRGGRNDIGNIQSLCEPCNNSKGSKIIDYR